jgi:hypothetical protein
VAAAGQMTVYGYPRRAQDGIAFPRLVHWQPALGSPERPCACASESPGPFRREVCKLGPSLETKG